jgi:hypothetical protein
MTKCKTRTEWFDLLHKCQNGDATCMFVLGEIERENALLQDALREALDGAAYTVSVDAILDPSTRHVGLERLARHRSLLPNAVDVCPDSESSLPNAQD